MKNKKEGGDKMSESNTPISTNPLIQELHDFRKQIDACIQKAGSYKIKPNEEVVDKRGAMQREISLVYTKLQEAKMWAGKCLEAIGSPFPEELRDEVK